jgi:hypothetical protein
MDGLPELRMPQDWKQRTRVFITAAAKPRRGLAPWSPAKVYDAERDPPASTRKPLPKRVRDILLRANAT